MNIDNINRLIAVVRDEPNHFKMEKWNTVADLDDRDQRITLARNNPCNTAGCLGGWADALALCDIADGKMEMPKPTNTGETFAWILARAFFGADAFGADAAHADDQLRALFHMNYLGGMQRFDRLPDAVRSSVAVRVLEIFRDTGRSNWTVPLCEAGIYDYCAHGHAVEIDGTTYF